MRFVKLSNKSNIKIKKSDIKDFSDIFKYVKVSICDIEEIVNSQFGEDYLKIGLFKSECQLIKGDKLVKLVFSKDSNEYIKQVYTHLNTEELTALMNYFYKSCRSPAVELLESRKNNIISNTINSLAINLPSIKCGKGEVNSNTS